MTKNKQDKLKRAHAMLSSLQNNIAQMGGNVPEKYVHKFHDVLNRLGGIDIDVTEYRVPDSEVKPIIDRPIMRVGGEIIKHYSEEKYVDKPFILTQLDAILGYLDSLISDKPEKPRKIGF